MGAGILPVVLFRGITYFMLAREADTGLWCDFGGSHVKGETRFKTAIREAYEETDGFLGDIYELRDRVHKNYINTMTTSDQGYKTYLFRMNYYESKNFINCFNNHRKFIVENELIIPKEGLFEKSEVKLFNKKDIILHNDEIRPFYREITNNLII